MTDQIEGLDTTGRETADSPEMIQAAQSNDWALTALRERPGFLIRRLHQIHTALFTQECASEGITPVQYSVLTALRQIGPSEQIVISRSVGLDRTSTADVMQRLEKRKLVRRRVSAKDRRSKITTLTDVGAALLERIDDAASRAHARTLEPLSAQERREVMHAMIKIVDAFPDMERKSF